MVVYICTKFGDYRAIVVGLREEEYGISDPFLSSKVWVYQYPEKNRAKILPVADRTPF